MRPDDITYQVIGAAMKVHSALGVGLLESASDKCLRRELTRAGLHFRHQVACGLSHDGVTVSRGRRVTLRP
jgi:GxxExxY protein